MKIKNWLNSRTAIVGAGLLLSAYLLLILTVANLGQSKLQASQTNMLQLKINNYANNLSFFFDANMASLSHFANNRSVNTYFSNLAAGMSLQYGLGSSLYELNKSLCQFIESNKVESLPTFTRLTIVGLGGTMISDTKAEQAFDLDEVNLKGAATKPHRIVVSSHQNLPEIQLIHTIYHQDKAVAILVAKINNEVLVHQLSMQEHPGFGSLLKLVTPKGNLLVWDSLKHQEHLGIIDTNVRDNQLTDHIYFEDVVSRTPFKLVSWFAPLNEQDVFTSAWFIVAISLLALPVLYGLTMLMRINNANIILQTEIEVSADQQIKLSEKNARLSDEVAKRKESEKMLAYQATHDELTGLANRSYSTQQLSDAIQRAERNGHQVLVIFLDLDNFKQINDTVGHHAGDELLQQTSERLKRVVRNSDTVARFGGDEFVVMLPELPSQEVARIMAMSILSLFEKPFVIDAQEFFVSTSIGMSIYPQDGSDVSHLLKKADTALYRVKEAGRNGFSFFDESMNNDVQRKLALNVRLHQALHLNDFEVHYQPILDLTTGKIIGAEALLRWYDDELGAVSPEEFIPLAEKNGLIHRLGEFVLDKACHQAAQWQTICPLKIAVNMSSVQFRYCEQLQAKIIRVLTSSGWRC
ncbi:bifunctional diguanylate cyclase/phosphodiesterase [Shewanella sp. NIFS-20-20]|uniref:putative bifunctional diguanylate cyclase/phosphodiesterase n=1 Tax=Shewanella sp. NIFS-20-20 TaxID=2853806 RepID=UPI001C45412A|nr:diguanylate cyclase [Shewanella sp. NIFS-20-20]MBV7316300.1 diguanylate cyclase [Shewanella sp. NIFS-20-20]